MSLVRALLGGPADRRVIDAGALTWSTLLGDATSKTGIAVGVDKALRVSTVLACARALAEDLSQLPLKLYRRQGRTTTPATDHPLFWRLSEGPNAWQSSFEWRESGMFHATLALGHFAIVIRGGRLYDVEELLPVPPEFVTVRQARDWTLSYEFSFGGKSVVLPQEEVFHVRGFSWNQYAALALIAQAREAIGLAIATEETQARMHSNGARPVGFLTTDKELGKVARERLKGMWQDQFGGLGNAWKTPVLDNGLKFQAAGLSGVDAQHLETRKFQIEEIARMLGVFPWRIGYSDKTATYASSESFRIGHVVFSIMPWIRRWEEAISRDLLSQRERRLGYFPKFNVNALLRGDAKSRSEFYRAALGTASSAGWMTPNEVRELEELDPLDGLDDVTIPKPGAEEEPPAPKAEGGEGEGGEGAPKEESPEGDEE